MAQLERFRADESLLVAAAAQWTFPGDETDEDETDGVAEDDDDLG